MNAFGSQKKPTGPLIVGLTGQTGAGKSTVTEAFAEKGFVVIDCDALAYGPHTKEPPFSGPKTWRVHAPRTHYTVPDCLSGAAVPLIAHPDESEVTAS